MWIKILINGINKLLIVDMLYLKIQHNITNSLLLII